MRLPHAALFSATISPILMLGCGTSDPNAFHAGCDHFNGVQVSAGLTPSIGWTPDCAAHQIAVFVALTPEDPGGDPISVGAEMWEVNSSQIVGNTIEPSVRYGQVPSGTMQGASPQPLVAGQPYVVVVSTLALNGPSVGARRFFTP